MVWSTYMEASEFRPKTIIPWVDAINKTATPFHAAAAIMQWKLFVLIMWVQLTNDCVKFYPDVDPVYNW